MPRYVGRGARGPVTAELTDRVEKTGAQRVKAIVRHISAEAPRLADLGEEQLEQPARVVVAETLKDGNPQNVQRNLNDQVSLEAEHSHDREKQRRESDRAYAGDEAAVIPLLALGAHKEKPCKQAGKERDTQIDENTLRDLHDGDVDRRALPAEHRQKHGNENPCVETVKEDLKDAVECHKTRSVFGVPFGQLVPHDDHCDAA